MADTGAVSTIQRLSRTLDDWVPLFKDNTAYPTRGGGDKKRPKNGQLQYLVVAGCCFCQGIPVCGRNTSRNKCLKTAPWNIRTLINVPDSALPRRCTALVAFELSCYDVDISTFSETRLLDGRSLTEVEAGYTLVSQGLPTAKQ